MNLEKLSFKYLAIYVSHFLRQNGIENVLTGGACVSIYTRNRYRSYDLDFVDIGGSKERVIRSVLAKIGFEKKGRIYVHQRIKFSLDILSPPLSIGEEKIEKVNSIKRGDMELKLLTPTDSVKDRLAAFYFWNDRQTLMQAWLICRDNRVNMAEVRKWSVREEEIEKFEIFLSGVKAHGASGSGKRREHG